jgi:hypothetical protein
MRLQIDTRVGKRLMQYVFPARRQRTKEDSAGTLLRSTPSPIHAEPSQFEEAPIISRSSVDSPRTVGSSTNAAHSLEPPKLRKLGSSRSFNDLRSAARESEHLDPSNPIPYRPLKLQRNVSFAPDSVVSSTMTDNSDSQVSLARSKGIRVMERSDTSQSLLRSKPNKVADKGDAEEMKTRSSQKTFVLVRVDR